MDRFAKGALDGLLSATLVVLIAVNSGLIPLDYSTKTAQAGVWPCYGCNKRVLCPVGPIGTCGGIVGTTGSCVGWGTFCIDGIPQCWGVGPGGPCPTNVGC